MACSCNSIREGSDGLSFSFAMLGVLCFACEGAIAEQEHEDWWNSLTPQQQISERWQDAQNRIEFSNKRPGFATKNVPF